jgi:hypothetical protein
MIPLPLMLAGPMRQHVETALVSVWVVLHEQCTVQLLLWAGGQIKPAPLNMGIHTNSVCFRR